MLMLTLTLTLTLMLILTLMLTLTLTLYKLDQKLLHQIYHFIEIKKKVFTIKFQYQNN